ncbi:hypothetical protein BGZ95_009649 [Linnemannia exigua]|uniref:Uncharacterized protein n=1 Tax=Linnemannia exigua TaxID=604196 RepID=A0AAD4DD25_9FUNG|nr:hypothetical protein BGZ95_009649 [Linnemannia exigua]
MTTNQHSNQLAVSIPFAPGHSSHPAPEQQEAPVPVPPVFVVAGSTPVSTPTSSGMHSPPLSGTLEEEANEKRAAHDAASIGRSQRSSDPGKTATPTLTLTTPPPTSLTPAPATNSSKRAGANVLSGNSRTGGAQKRGSPSVTATATTPKPVKTKSDVKTTQPKNLSDMEMHTPSHRTRDSTSSAHSFGARTTADYHLRPDLHVVRRPQSKEKTIEHVLQQGKILKVSRRLRTRLEYAILKIRRGWTKYTLQEVESLIQPVCSPRITPRQIHQSISLQSSPLLTERRRVHSTTHQRRLSDPARIEQFMGSDIDRQQAPLERFRSRMPSLSQFKDSELFLPAKSLMEIAASKPEPGYLSPFLGAQSSPYMQQSSSAHNSPHSRRYGAPEPLYRDTTPVRETSSRANWSRYSSPARDEPMEEDEQSENGVPSEAQVARTILMLSSPTRPAPRTLNQNYTVETHSESPIHSPLGEWTAPYSPMTSSPLVQFQTMDSASPSPDRPPTMSAPSTPHHLTDKERGASPSSSSVSSSHKRAVKFAAAATQGSLDPSSGLSVERIKDKITGLTGRGEYNSTADMIYPGSQPGYDDKKEYSPAPSYASPAYGNGFAHQQHQRDITPPPQQQSTSSSSPSAFSVPGLTYNNHSGNNHHSGHHGMRTPPPSGGKDMDMSQYSSLGAQGSRTAMRMRRDSGMAQTGKTDDLTTLLRRGAPSSSSSSRPGPPMYRS